MILVFSFLFLVVAIVLFAVGGWARLSGRILDIWAVGGLVRGLIEMRGASRR